MSEAEKSPQAELRTTFEEEAVDDLNKAILAYTQISAETNPEEKFAAKLRVQAALDFLTDWRIKLGPFIVPKIDGLLQRKK